MKRFHCLKVLIINFQEIQVIPYLIKQVQVHRFLLVPLTTRNAPNAASYMKQVLLVNFVINVERNYKKMNFLCGALRRKFTSLEIIAYWNMQH